MTLEQSLDGLTQVLQEVPAVGDLCGTGRTLRGCLGLC
jgi:hypothetical protein